MRANEYQTRAMSTRLPSGIREADKFCRNEKDLYVCSVLYSERQSILPVCSGHFLCPDATYTRFRTPVWSVNAPTAALV